MLTTPPAPKRDMLTTPRQPPPRNMATACPARVFSSFVGGAGASPRSLRPSTPTTLLGH